MPHLEPDHLMAPAGPPQFTAPRTSPPVMAPPSFSQPAAPGPTFGGPPPVDPRTQGGKGRELAMLIPAMLAGIKDPQVLGQALAGLQRGKERKLAQYENAVERHERQQREAAEFYERAQREAAQIEDEVEFERWRTMIGPSAELRGVSPGLFTFNRGRAEQRTRSALVAQLDAMERRDPTLAARDDFRIKTPDHPEGIEVRFVRAWRAEAVGPNGRRIVPTPKPEPTRLHTVTTTGPDGTKVTKAVTDEELRAGVPAYVEPERPTTPTVGERQATRREQQERVRGRLRLALRNPASADLPTLTQEAQRAGLDFDVERDAAAREIEREALARSRATDLLPVDAVDGLTTADALLAAFDAELRRQRASAGRSATPGGGQAQRTASRADVRAVAERMGTSETEARRQLEAAGVVIDDRSGRRGQ